MAKQILMLPTPVPAEAEAKPIFVPRLAPARAPAASFSGQSSQYLSLVMIWHALETRMGASTRFSANAENLLAEVLDFDPQIESSSTGHLGSPLIVLPDRKPRSVQEISADDQWMCTIRHCPFTCLSIIVSTDRLLIARVRYVPETVSTLMTQAISPCSPCVRLTKVRGTAALKAASASR